MENRCVNSCALSNIELLTATHKALTDAVVRIHWSPEQQKRYKELDSAFTNAIKAESERLET